MAFSIGGVELDSRFFLGTASYPSPAVLVEAVRASGTQVITVGLRRQLAGGDSEAGDGFFQLIKESGAHLLPNTAGCTTAREAVNLARMAREVFEEVDEALGQKLSRIMREGPEEELVLTENAQPAIMANAMAVLRVLEKEGGLSIAANGECVAGHSLGEYSALCAAGAFSLADTARLLRLRGQAMQAAVPVGVGAMCALLGADTSGLAGEPLLEG